MALLRIRMCASYFLRRVFDNAKISAIYKNADVDCKRPNELNFMRKLKLF